MRNTLNNQYTERYWKLDQESNFDGITVNNDMLDQELSIKTTVPIIGFNKIRFLNPIYYYVDPDVPANNQERCGYGLIEAPLNVWTKIGEIGHIIFNFVDGKILYSYHGMYDIDLCQFELSYYGIDSSFLKVPQDIGDLKPKEPTPPESEEYKFTLMDGETYKCREYVLLATGTGDIQSITLDFIPDSRKQDDTFYGYIEDPNGTETDRYDIIYSNSVARNLVIYNKGDLTGVNTNKYIPIDNITFRIEILPSGTWNIYYFLCRSDMINKFDGILKNFLDPQGNDVIYEEDFIFTVLKKRN